MEDNAMTTASIGEIYDFVARKKMTMEFWGATLEFQNQFNAYCQKIGTLIMDQQSVSPELAKDLPREMKVSKKVHQVFLELKNWANLNE
jgi:hypothetical protein